VRIPSPFDPLLARLLGAPAQILADPFNIIGRGGWLIGDAVRPGADGGSSSATAHRARSPARRAGPAAS
jgi:hypothetical protein